VTDTSHHKYETFLYEYPLHSVLLPIKMHKQCCSSIEQLFKHGRYFDYWNQPLKMCMRVCYLDSWSWTVLLPSDTHRKPITAVLLPFLACLLTLPCTRLFNTFFKGHLFKLSWSSHFF
jgi:hypothetical protein